MPACDGTASTASSFVTFVNFIVNIPQAVAVMGMMAGPHCYCTAIPPPSTPCPPKLTIKVIVVIIVMEVIVVIIILMGIVVIRVQPVIAMIIEIRMITKSRKLVIVLTVSTHHKS